MTAQPATDAAPALILVVDDNPTNRYVLTTSLRRAGHSVLEAEDGTDALGLLGTAETLPEAAIVDVRLPDMTGFEVCERIKTHPRTRSLPVIHISASAISVTDRAQGLNRGADAYLTEPIAPDELLATVTATLRYTRARHRAESAARRLVQLNRTTLALYSAPDATALVRAAADGAAEILATASAAVLTSPQGQVVRAARAAGEGTAAEAHAQAEPDLPAEILARHALRNRTGAAVDVMETRGRPLLPAEADGGDVLAVAAARAKHGRAPVVIAVPEDALATVDDRELLTQLAHATALALEALRTYSEEHALALTLQRSFLPERLPETRRAELAVRYLPASEQAEIGGDFYEALVTPGGLVVAVGDVAGHSLDAAMVMGQVRHALRAYAMDAHEPHEILNRIDRLLVAQLPGTSVTLCIIRIPHDGDTVTIANAGHLPPLLRVPGAHPAYVDEHGPLLGLGLSHPPAVGAEAPPGTEILLVTDGLVERKGVSLDTSLAALADAMARAPHDPEAMCDALLLTFPTDGNDDVALMALRLLPRTVTD